MADKFTTNEIAEYYAIFHKFSKDEQDRIRSRHLSVLFMTVVRYPDDKEIAEIMKGLKDPNYMSFWEFLELMAPSGNIVNAFRVFDPKRTGRVCAATLREFFKQNNATRKAMEDFLAVVDFDDNC